MRRPEALVTDALRQRLLGAGERWDDGELAQVLISGLALATIEDCDGLLSLPWPLTAPAQSSPEAAQALLSKVIDGGDDPNLKAVKALTDTRKQLSRRQTDVAELFGNTTSRSGRNRLKGQILPWFLDHLVERLQSASDHLRASGQPGRTPARRKPLLDEGNYRSDLTSPIDPTELGDAFKGRLVQIALDVSTVDEAVRLAQIAASSGADLIEIGDPIIKRFGMGAVEQIRAMVPGMPTVVEFASSDWVDEQIDMAADAGADIIFVLGLDHPSRIERAVRAARSRRVGIVLAMPSHAEPSVWCSMVEDAGADAISLIRNIDSSESIQLTTSRIRQVANLTSIPLVISGGFGPHNISEVLDDTWSVVIVGGAFINSRDPASVLTSMRETLDHDR